MGAAIVDPDGVPWTVRRRWYPWRRALSLRDLLSSTPGTKKADASESSEPDDTALPRNVLLKVLFVVAAAIVWVVYSVGKVLFYVAVVVLFLVGSVVELCLALVVMPITLLLRVIGRSRWPVEIGRQGEHVATRHAHDFAAAGALRDATIAEIERGVLPMEPVERTA
ncbi:hypothetical protein TUM20985_02050 [Mycobacterium antarcticum]|uniref:hypothetical protein n=1 Tax=unclassified Mycolicibacterium TaxID=2636767 RepID=UPI00238882F9|nr:MULTISPECIES: hypothetical protein [unclassified Mycolicibacterium]BDX29658.1 hypothetical protein TUM20985_02050 [Mycolicibacterium sp. TUM20985]GLP73086.1 hypothetical protein TUM20983_01960 [Mycolicibacterium sp. TUM20983]GLP78800.1 hypothetical protein TUM20984_02200 [Mycolicibacterium sp. TUM20984]